MTRFSSYWSWMWTVCPMDWVCSRKARVVGIWRLMNLTRYACLHLFISTGIADKHKEKNWWRVPIIIYIQLLLIDVYSVTLGKFWRRYYWCKEWNEVWQPSTWKQEWDREIHPNNEERWRKSYTCKSGKINFLST